MKLIFINRIGRSFTGENIFEFLFSDLKFSELLSSETSDWDSAGSPEISVPMQSVKTAYRLKANISLDLIQENDYFCMLDAVDGIIALGWESGDIYGKNRLVFNFGDDFELVKTKLYNKDNYIEKCYETTKQ